MKQFKKKLATSKDKTKNRDVDDDEFENYLGKIKKLDYFSGGKDNNEDDENDYDSEGLDDVDFTKAINNKRDDDEERVDDNDNDDLDEEDDDLSNDEEDDLGDDEEAIDYDDDTPELNIEDDFGNFSGKCFFFLHSFLCNTYFSDFYNALVYEYLIYLKFYLSSYFLILSLIIIFINFLCFLS